MRKIPWPCWFACLTLVGIAMVAAEGRPAAAHCQVPCGIYDHHARIHQMREDAATIAKATSSLLDLAGKADAMSRNQAVRWINTKEEHADNIQKTVSEYFLTQVVKPADPSDKDAYAKYLQTLADHHAVLVAAMKTKQTVDPTAVDALGAALDKLENYYAKE
ncbi:MAG: superoxide dismutase, Ni [Deltaproteobacteria bacterium]|nr:superoxide dismutase, Ni [Deltaproteobacteria bacterium]